MVAKYGLRDWLLMLGIFVGIVFICALFILFTMYFLIPYKYYSLSNDYNCSIVSRSLSGDGFIPRSESRLGVIGGFSVDNMLFWYDNNCRESSVNSSLSIVSVPPKDNVLLCRNGNIGISGDSAVWSNCTISSDDGGLHNKIVIDVNLSRFAQGNIVDPVIYTGDCCYPLECYRNIDEYINSSCNRNCEYPVFCYRNGVD